MAWIRLYLSLIHIYLGGQGEHAALSDGENIKLVVKYDMKLPFSVFGLQAIPMESKKMCIRDRKYYILIISGIFL